MENNRNNYIVKNEQYQLEKYKRLRKHMNIDNLNLDNIIERGVVPEMLQLICYKKNAEIQIEILCILINFTTKGEDRVKYLLKLDILSYLFVNIESNNIDVKDKSLWLICNIVGNSYEIGSLVINRGIVKRLLLLYEFMSLSKNISWLIYNLCRLKPPPNMQDITQLFNILRYYLLNNTDVKTKINAIHGIWKIYKIGYRAAFQQEIEIIKKLFELLEIKLLEGSYLKIVKIIKMCCSDPPKMRDYVRFGLIEAIEGIILKRFLFLWNVVLDIVYYISKDGYDWDIQKLNNSNILVEMTSYNGFYTEIKFLEVIYNTIKKMGDNTNPLFVNKFIQKFNLIREEQECILIYVDCLELIFASDLSNYGFKLVFEAVGGIDFLKNAGKGSFDDNLKITRKAFGILEKYF